MISFDHTLEEGDLIERIAKRAHDFRPDIDVQHFFMDIAATHANGCPLDLQKLADADEFNFIHDVFGIYRHLDRDDTSPTAGQLLDCFVPRCYKEPNREP